MGATIIAKDHFSFTYGTLANNYSSVGYSYDDSGIQYPDHWGINLRVTIRTDGLGANYIKIGGLGRPGNYGTGLRLIVNQSADAYCKGATTDGVLLNADGTGGANVTLSPNTTYYVWLVNHDQWPYYSYIYSTLNLTVTASGSYGAPATPVVNNGTFGEALGITLTGGSAGAGYVVTAQCAGRSETVSTWTDGTALSWTAAVETFAPLITNANSAAATITVDTYYAGVKVGSRSANITLGFAAGSIAPVCSPGWVSAAPLNTGAVAGYTGYAQGYSRARVTFDASKISPQYGATIASYAIACGGTTAVSPPYDTGVLTGASASIVCTVTDSRGQATSVTLTVNLTAYARPSLSAVNVFRSDAQGAADEGGSCASARATANISSLDGWNRVESLNAYVRTLTGVYGAAIAMQSGTACILDGLSPDAAYEIKLELTDRLSNTAAVTRRLATRRWAMKFRPDGNGVAFGKAAEVNEALELANSWTLVLRDANGNAVTLDHDKLTRLLALLN